MGVLLRDDVEVPASRRVSAPRRTHAQSAAATVDGSAEASPHPPPDTASPPPPSRPVLDGPSAPAVTRPQSLPPTLPIHAPFGSRTAREGYFVGGVLQFQLHRALCIAAGQWDPLRPDARPLHQCDIYRSAAAGDVLKRLMSLGLSAPWSQTLYAATGEPRINGSALRDFFRPLEEWLRLENLRTGEFAGWVYDGDYCRTSLETARLQVRGGYYNIGARTVSLTPILIAISLLLPISLCVWRPA